MGRIEVVIGPMFCGKTEELVRRLRRAQIARKEVRAFKPVIDNRYHKTNLGSHGGVFFNAIPIERACDILDHIVGVEVVGIDEGQFFDEGLPALCEDLAGRGVRVIVAGLDLDTDNNPFGTIPTLMCLAEEVTKLSAVCMVCGDTPASRTVYKGSAGKAAQIEVGAEQYEARCRKCARGT